MHAFVIGHTGMQHKVKWLSFKPCMWTTPTAYLPMCICTS